MDRKDPQDPKDNLVRLVRQEHLDSLARRESAPSTVPSMEACFSRMALDARKFSN